MLKKRINYVDYNCEERSEDFYFNLNEAEIAELQVSKEGGFTEYINRIIDAKNPKELMGLFKEIIMLSHGIKSPDGKRFIKSDQITEEFTQTEAFVALFMELATNTEAATEFIKGIVPKKNVKQE